MHRARGALAQRLCLCAMQLLSLLATCVGLASAVTVTYPAGCPDSSYDNYYPENPTGSSSSCVSAPTLYCPDSNANNYLAGFVSGGAIRR